VNTYDISASQLVNLLFTCPGTNIRFNQCLSILKPGFTWMDTASGTPISVRVEFNLGVSCVAQGSPPDPTYLTTLNGEPGATFVDTSPLCPCAANSGHVYQVDAPPIAYNVGGVNTFLITDPISCMGFAPRTEFGGAFARVTVAYNPSPPDCNANSVPDACDIGGSSSMDDDGDGVPDECQVAAPALSGWGIACQFTVVAGAGMLILWKRRRAFGGEAYTDADKGNRTWAE